MGDCPFSALESLLSCSVDNSLLSWALPSTLFEHPISAHIKNATVTNSVNKGTVTHQSIERKPVQLVVLNTRI